MTKLQAEKPLLDSSLNLRAVQWADVNAVAQLIYDVCEADGDTTVAVTPDELKHEWKNEGFKLETDAFLVETKEGRVVGYEEFADVQAITICVLMDTCIPILKDLVLGHR